ncbi:hypothetical protein AB0L88_12960 [Saccharopolyspora shandongensis]
MGLPSSVHWSVSPSLIGPPELINQVVAAKYDDGDYAENPIGWRLPGR